MEVKKSSQCITIFFFAVKVYVIHKITLDLRFFSKYLKRSFKDNPLKEVLIGSQNFLKTGDQTNEGKKMRMKIFFFFLITSLARRRVQSREMSHFERN
jgi:hypothetical protein